MYRFLLALLLITSFAAAQDYVVYGPEDTFAANGEVSVVYERGDDADFNEKATIYAALKRIAEDPESTQEQKDAATDARNETLEALARAKADDAIILRTATENLILRYGECKSTATEVACFKSVLYLEEDTQPLGDTTLNSVKYEQGELRLPVTISFEAFETKALIQRSIAKTTLYPGEKTTVNILYRNTGNTDIVGARITEEPPFSAEGDLTAFKGGLLPGEALSFTYTVTAGEPGTYVFNAAVNPPLLTIEPTTVTVKEPATVIIATTRKDVNEPAPFTITVTNTYTETIDIDDLTITTNDRFERRSGVRNTRYEDQRITRDDTTIEPGKNITINGSVIATAPGTGTLTVTARITAARQELIKKSASYTIGPPLPAGAVETPQEPIVNEEPPASSAPQETGEEPASQEPVDTPAEAPVEQPPIPSTTKDDRGFLKKILDWLDGLFK